MGSFGPLTILAISRRDLVAMKVIGAPKRPQDLEDLVVIKPTAEEIDFVRRHLDRLESESLARDTYDAARTVLHRLEQDDEREQP